ncbi:MAG TPA: MraY family glycosyltransferase [Bacteroidales bacterium]|nr:MraY family glycosyltransferase [Bacteroidales bacterium]
MISLAYGGMFNLLGVFLPDWILIGTAAVLAFSITMMAIPVIVRVARLKNLCAIPNGRSSHVNAVPNLGGVGVFAGLVISTLLIAGNYFSFEMGYIICGFVILFFVGIKDDILVIDPRKKLAAQFAVAVMLVVFSDIRINSFFEILNIGEISYTVSIIISVLLIVLLINGFNLIDGIDGLAAGTGILASVSFGLWFRNTGSYGYTVMCFSLAGSLAAFIFFNVFGKKNKVFMGDTGSLLIGIAVSVMVIRFLRSDHGIILHRMTDASPALALSVIILPLFDTIRIFIIRICQGRSPFTADHQHIHHRLLEMGYSHLKSTLILISVNIFFLFLCFFFRAVGDLLMICIVFSLSTVSSWILLIMAKHHLIRSARREDRQTSDKDEDGEKHVKEVARELELSHYN